MSPRSTSAFHASSDSCPTPARLIIACSWVPSPSCSVAKQSLPELRANTTRPATPTMSPVSVSAGQVGVGGTDLGQGVGARAPRPGTARGPRRAAARAWPGGSGTARGDRPRSRRAEPQGMSRRASLNESDGCDASTRRRWQRWPTSRWTGASRACPPRGGDARPRRSAPRPGAVRRRAARTRCACCAPRPWRTTWRRWPAGVATAGSSWPRTARRTWRRSWLARPARRGRVRGHGGHHQPGARPTARSACAISCWPTSSSMPAGLRWVAAELDADPDFTLVCWVDSVRGVELMTSALAAAELRARSTCASRWARPAGAPAAASRGRRRRGGAGRGGLAARCGWSGWPDTRPRWVTTSRPTGWPASRDLPVGAARRR